MSKLYGVFVGLFLSFLSSFAFATAPATLADLTGGISLATATTAILAVALLIIGFKVMKQGAMIVLRFIGWAK